MAAGGGEALDLQKAVEADVLAALGIELLAGEEGRAAHGGGERARGGEGERARGAEEGARKGRDERHFGRREGRWEGRVLLQAHLPERCRAGRRWRRGARFGRNVALSHCRENAETSEGAALRGEPSFGDQYHPGFRLGRVVFRFKRVIQARYIDDYSQDLL